MDTQSFLPSDLGNYLRTPISDQVILCDIHTIFFSNIHHVFSSSTTSSSSGLHTSMTTQSMSTPLSSPVPPPCFVPSIASSSSSLGTSSPLLTTRPQNPTFVGTEGSTSSSVLKSTAVAIVMHHSMDP
ncbi:hypothetical protein Pelo_17515 [Pelomyxa schiedti]|nr:hypothetical protein Pelo_17515 [Pelomyxa schiedti]